MVKISKKGFLGLGKNKTHKDKYFKKNLHNGDWGAYIDINRKLLNSLEKLKNYVNNVEKHSDIDERDIHSFGAWATSFRINDNSELHGTGSSVEKILINLRSNSHRVSEIFEGDGEEEGLITLIRNELNKIENLIQNNPAMPTDIQMQLAELTNTFNSKKLRRWEELRDIFAREKTLGMSLINYEEMSIKDFALALIKQAKELDSIIENNSSDEAILMKFLEIANGLEGFRSVLRSDIKREIMISNKADKNFKKEILTIGNNYLDRYKSPIKDRVDSVMRILKSHENSFIEIPDEEKEKVLALYNEFISYVIKGTKYEDKFKDRKISTELSETKRRFEELVSKLREKVAQNYSIPSEDAFENLHLLKSKENMFQNYFGKVKKHQGDTLTIKLVKSKLSENKNNVKKLLSEINKNIGLYLTDNGFKSFESIQPADNFIGNVLAGKKKKEFMQKYWDEYGKNLDDSAIVIYQQFTEFSGWINSINDPKLNKSFDIGQFKALGTITQLFDKGGIDQNRQNQLSEFYNNFSQFTGHARNILKTSSQNAENGISICERSLNSLKKAKKASKKEKLERELESEENERISIIENLEDRQRDEISRLRDEIIRSSSEKNSISSEIKSLRSKLRNLSPNQFTKTLQEETRRGGILQRDIQDTSAFQNQQNYLKEEISRLEGEINIISAQIDERSREMSKLENEPANSQRLDTINKKIEDLQKEIDKSKINIKVDIPIIDRPNFIINSLKTKKREIDDDILDSTIIELESMKEEFLTLVENHNNAINNFNSLNVFVTSVMQILSMFSNPHTLKKIEKSYMSQSVWGNTPKSEIWYELNDGFKNLQAGTIYSMVSKNNQNNSYPSPFQE